MTLFDIIVGIIRLLLTVGAIMTPFVILMGSVAIILHVISGLMYVCEFVYQKLKEIIDDAV